MFIYTGVAFRGWVQRTRVCVACRVCARVSSEAEGFVLGGLELEGGVGRRRHHRGVLLLRTRHTLGYKTFPYCR